MTPSESSDNDSDDSDGSGGIRPGDDSDNYIIIYNFYSLFSDEWNSNHEPYQLLKILLIITNH